MDRDFAVKKSQGCARCPNEVVASKMYPLCERCLSYFYARRKDFRRRGDELTVEEFTANKPLPRLAGNREMVHTFRPVMSETKIAVLPQRVLEFVSGFIVYGPVMQKLTGLISRVAPTNATVLIEGERGTGKELVASAICQKSNRVDGPFITLECTTLNPELIESELFGHEKGAFTGAIAAKKGIFESADRGTLFLDEIADMSLLLQAKLLRVLETREFRRVGSTYLQHTNVRIVAATNSSLRNLVRVGKFRADLYDRLNVFSIKVSPLRARREEIPVLALYFLQSFGRDTESLSDAALNVLTGYSWPGNVRELRNALERAHILADGGIITAEHLPEALFVRDDGTEQISDNGPPRNMKDVELAHIERVIAYCEGDKRKAAEVLGMSLKTVYNRLAEIRSRCE